MKSQIFTTAWAYIKANIFTNISDALKAAWKEYKTKLALRAGEVKLTFRKANGEITERTATLHYSFMPSSWKRNRAAKLGLIVFWSITDGAFRSCRIERLLEFTSN